ncbi:primosomal protein N' [Fusobacterium sp.]|uniref:replication restart helicase PriA n=1 Tax=Fusobacterium sp. TaxID=68766 RepID=UPI002639C2CB|nr:primosomal protein N' [Fusobacterium sp.]
MKYYKLFVDGTNSFFTYLDSEEIYNIGDRVLVSFRNREKGALIVQEDKTEKFDFKVLEIKRKLENEISLSPKYIELLLWISSYYLCNFSQVISAALPKELKIKYEEFYRLNFLIDLNELKDDEIKIIKYLREKISLAKTTLRKNFSLEEIKEYLEINLIRFEDEESKRLNFNYTEYESYLGSEKYKKVYEYFLQRNRFSKKSLEEKFDKKLIERVVNKNYIIFEKKIFEREFDSQEEIKKIITDDLKLTENQESIVKDIENKNEKYFLIKGITGSGKTEIYIRLIKNSLKEKKGSIFLVPEISLTPQMKERFTREFGDEVAVLHSNISDKEKQKEWLNIIEGKKKVVLGARSAIFAPVKDLAYIIIDEEHENSYKQDTNPRYNAKYVAIKKAILENCKIVMGSATPDIESYYLGKKNQFQLEILDKRYNNIELPDIDMVDMKNEENNFFSKELLKSIRDTLLKGEQVILLLNRKGYSTMIQCKDCGYIEECEHCSIKLSYYESTKKLKCNYCGRERNFYGKCSKCGSKNLHYGGKGTEQIEEKLKEIFDVSIIRVDSETARQKDFYEKTYFDFLNKKYDIMIGTQMIAKGLHFPNVTLVGVINADLILSFPDFRASEKTFQLITQVAGRAGRGDKKGKVIIQTYQPENYVMENIKNSDYEAFYNKEIEMREILEYPPFSKTINIGFSHTDEKLLERVTAEFFKLIKREYVNIFAPNKSLVYKVKDRYRKNIFIKGKKDKINYFKKELLETLEKFDSKGCRIVIDVDPINLI